MIMLKNWQEVKVKYKPEKCMSNQLITSENERIKSILSSLDHLHLSLECFFSSRKPTLNGESFYTDDELSKKLKISRSSLQDYRDEGRIPYIKLGGKLLYRSSDIEKLLEDNYQEKWKNISRQANQ